MNEYLLEQLQAAARKPPEDYVEICVLIEESADVIRAQEAEIQRLREYEFMYKELCD